MVQQRCLWYVPERPPNTSLSEAKKSLKKLVPATMWAEIGFKYCFTVKPLIDDVVVTRMDFGLNIAR